ASLKLMDFLGVRSGSRELQFPFSESEKIKYEQLKKTHGLRKKGFVIFHPGAKDKMKRWKPQKFAKVGDILATRGYMVVLTGSMDERETVALVADMMNYPCVNLCGKTDLGTLGLLIKDAALLLAN